MLIFKIIQCFFQGHAIVVITSNKHAYRYCIRCGKLETQDQVFTGRDL
jgi:hypothetical protein